MNSGLQCLSNIYELTQYFISGKYTSEINSNNALGSGGNFVETYAQFIQSIWNSDVNPVTPSKLKKALGALNPTYAGYSQQDSQELISFILDMLHEDLNRVKKKPYIITKDYLAEDSLRAGNECWENYLRRNQSIIVDLLHGMYKSSLFCPGCKNNFLTFDPFCVLSLPIPTKGPKSLPELIPIYIVPYSCEYLPQAANIEIRDNQTIYELKKEIAESMGESPDDYVFGITGFMLQRIVNNNSQAISLKSLMKTNNAIYLLMMYQIKPSIPKMINIEISKEYEIVNTDNNQNLPYNYAAIPLIFGFENSELNKVEHPTYSRMLFLDKSFTAIQIYHEIFEYVKTFIKIHYNTLVSKNAADTFREIPYSELFGKLFPIKHDLDDGISEEMLGNYFTLKIVNNSKTGECKFCNKTDCKNCMLEYSDKITLQNLLDKIDDPNSKIANKTLYEPFKTREKIFELELVWSYKSRAQISPRTVKFTTLKTVSTSRTQNNKDKSNKTISIYDCFELFGKPDVLDDKNKWFCTKCKQHVQATKTMCLYKAPPILIISLKRFKSFASGMKIADFIEFPVKGLDISKFVEFSATSSSSTSPESPDSRSTTSSTKKLYDLFAVSNHFGGLGGGHYTAYAMNAEFNRWFNFDDSHVTPVNNENDVVTQNAYVLFYRRQDIDPLHIKYEDFVHFVKD